MALGFRRQRYSRVNLAQVDLTPRGHLLTRIEHQVELAVISVDHYRLMLEARALDLLDNRSRDLRADQEQACLAKIKR